MPLLRFTAVPSGCTATSFAVKSVSGADDDAHRSTLIGPVISVLVVSGAVVYVSTSGRCSTARWS
ncbi:Uncharacterised protein [Mycobacteroides abscessus subsp. abscessus]|nr:Uncharacterised protein [Mycobacteroides abscessus subsp. abscessus]